MFKSIGSLLLAVLAITAAAVPARADLFNYTGSIQTFTVATTGVYNIVSAGAQGGSGDSDSGGLGAVVSGNALLTAGTVLDIIVGQAGGAGSPFNGGGGGGGGSFVYDPLALQPLEAAGGGGGAGFSGTNGNDALTGTSGGNGQGPNGGAGGTSGIGGAAGTFSFGLNGGGGAGWTGNGGTSGGILAGSGGQTAPLWADGAGDQGGDGGYGGGGGGGSDSGGGGGGYSGGGGGDGFRSHGAGGGGSYIDPSLFSTTPIAITQTGDGFVTITPDFVATPEPGSVLLLGSAFIGLGVARRRRTRTR